MLGRPRIAFPKILLPKPSLPHLGELNPRAYSVIFVLASLPPKLNNFEKPVLHLCIVLRGAHWCLKCFILDKVLIQGAEHQNSEPG